MNNVVSQPAYLTGFRCEGAEVPCPMGYANRGALRRTQTYVEHVGARRHRWVRYIDARSRKLVRDAG